MSNTKRYETGTRNVFKDIGVPNAEEHLVKAQLVFEIDRIMKGRGLKQVEAAELFGVRQPDVSKMLRSNTGYPEIVHNESSSRLPHGRRKLGRELD